MSEIRVSLDHEDFKKLISGGIVCKDGAKILLQDIGYHMMYESLYDEMLGKGYNMIKPLQLLEIPKEGSYRTHESIRCENKECENMVIRKLGASYPTFCSECSRVLDKKLHDDANISHLTK